MYSNEEQLTDPFTGEPIDPINQGVSPRSAQTQALPSVAVLGLSPAISATPGASSGTAQPANSPAYGGGTLASGHIVLPVSAIYNGQNYPRLPAQLPGPGYPITFAFKIQNDTPDTRLFGVDATIIYPSGKKVDLVTTQMIIVAGNSSPANPNFLGIPSNVVPQNETLTPTPSPESPNHYVDAANPPAVYKIQAPVLFITPTKLDETGVYQLQLTLWQIKNDGSKKTMDYQGLNPAFTVGVFGPQYNGGALPGIKGVQALGLAPLSKAPATLNTEFNIYTRNINYTYSGFHPKSNVNLVIFDLNGKQVGGFTTYSDQNGQKTGQFSFAAPPGNYKVMANDLFKNQASSAFIQS